MRATITSIKQEGTSQKIVTLQTEPFSFLPGQSIAINVNIPDKNILHQKRYYAIASAPGQALELLIKDSTSTLGHTFYEHLKEGQEHTFEGPYGKIVLPETFSRIILIGGGSGIAPCMSIIRTHYGKTPILLFYSTKILADTPYLPELEDLTKKGLLHVHALTQEPHPEKHQGRITLELLKKHLSSLEGVYLLYGPQPMIKDVAALLTQLGIQKEQILFEAY
ncbi:MAG: FAD-dependent oxidoreductase [Candidatus Nanoarchaeia archaeon]